MSRRVVAIVAVAMVAVPGAFAAEWRVNPAVGASVVSESNPGFALESANDQHAVAMDLGLSLEGHSETTILALNSSVARRQYSEDRSLNRSDLLIDLSLQHLATERLSWSTSVSATRDTTLTSELGTSGVTRAGFRHESFGAQLRPQWQMSERVTTSMLLQMQRDFYPTAGSGLVDYQYRSTSLIGSWRSSAQGSLGIVLRGGQMRVAQAASDVEDASASLEYTHTFNSRWSLRVAAGPSWARGARGVQSGVQSGENISVDLSRNAQYGALSLSIERAIAPTGRGYLTRRDSMSLQMRRDLAAELSGSLTASYLRSRNVIGVLGFTFDDVRYRRVEARLGWQFSPQWSSGLHAGYSDQQQSFSGASASGVDLGLGIRWNGKNHVL